MRHLEEPNQSNIFFPELIRVSTGTAVVLNLLEGKIDAEPTTAYLMTYSERKCTANCGFCPQARESKSSNEMLSRVSWPIFSTLNVLTALGIVSKQGRIKRVCIQALNYPNVFADLESLVMEIKKRIAIAVSVSCQPHNKEHVKLLAKAGVDRLGIALDAATEGLFNKIKGKDAGGPYSWNKQFLMLNEAITAFGKGNVGTHLIVGLGEKEKEAAQLIQKCADMSVLPALFAFTPIHGTALEKCCPPVLESYRRIQIARHLIVNGLVRVDSMRFDVEGKISSFGVSLRELGSLFEDGSAFRTSGCADCNRPFYNEKPGGPIYNYPKKLSQDELEKIRKQFSAA